MKVMKCVFPSFLHLNFSEYKDNIHICVKKEMFAWHHQKIYIVNCFFVLFLQIESWHMTAFFVVNLYLKLLKNNAKGLSLAFMLYLFRRLHCMYIISNLSRVFNQKMYTLGTKFSVIPILIFFPKLSMNVVCYKKVAENLVSRKKLRC